MYGLLNHSRAGYMLRYSEADLRNNFGFVVPILAHVPYHEYTER